MRVWERDGSFYFQNDGNSYVNFIKTNRVKTKSVEHFSHIEKLEQSLNKYYNNQIF